MNILITGAAGFVGKNLTAALECIRDGRDKTHPGLTVGELYLYDIDSDPALLETACRKADFVFNLAGVNRPKNQEEFMQGNFGFASTLLDTLKKYHNTCPVMLSSSIQATMVGRYAGSEYGRSKKAGEELFFSYAAETGAKVLVYRFPNLFGKWCRPNYNSAVATFCHNYAHDLPITVNDPGVELELLYIDDLVDEMIAALEGREHHCEFEGVDTVLTASGRYCAAPVTHRATLGQIVALLDSFKAQPQTLLMPEIPAGRVQKMKPLFFRCRYFFDSLCIQLCNQIIFLRQFPVRKSVLRKFRFHTSHFLYHIVLRRDTLGYLIIRYVRDRIK